RWSLSGSFVLSTGQALTLPVGRYLVEGSVVNEYQERNGFRMPTYHRTDLGLSRLGPWRSGFRGEWVFQVYNVYNRLNPYYIYFDVFGSVEDFSLQVVARKVALFPVLPSVTYRFTWSR
ncbi:MAG: TonB-dependent receptor, partial [Cytophagales bacterium]|nr:TonB-dependent receptor [Cytophagales bacterium]